jgi:collagenase-like PrtC family protease
MDYFRDLRVEKICLPRHLSTEEIRRLNENKGDLELEVFIMCGLCVFTEGYCSMHALPYGDEGEPCYCFSVKGVHGETKGGRKDKGAWVEGHWASRKLDGCGLCAIPKFEEMEMDSLKIEGRDEPLHDRIAYASAVRDLLKVYREQKPAYGAYTDIAKKYCDDNVAPCHPKNCYY